MDSVGATDCYQDNRYPRGDSIEWHACYCHYPKRPYCAGRHYKKGKENASDAFECKIKDKHYHCRNYGKHTLEVSLYINRDQTFHRRFAGKEYLLSHPGPAAVHDRCNILVKLFLVPGLFEFRYNQRRAAIPGHNVSNDHIILIYSASQSFYLFRCFRHSFHEGFNFQTLFRASDVLG